eukprot:gnl/TRDRNA2_/TRDRNA2_120830_c3_seq1.p1 gnl/TRDRNA2_/TRDRNA2_120830_c3~~gnl/TRDRNA2_/TRDRNA2_120830_c3_seq1.p1  ORF type:complete len:334 (+),score=53.78 gnl/TRDRNA2_/TRDRNA2_120830_c3_seq1:129-1004(+)
MSSANLTWIEPFSFTFDGLTCVYGCHPMVCEEHYSGGIPDGEFSCITNCAQQLELSLGIFFISHIVSTIVFVAIPIILTYYSIHREKAKVESSESDDDASPFSLLQLQAKCDEVAKYAYLEWGGSFVEDFLELAIGFALLTCFGLVLPVMAFFAFISILVEFRLIAYRMVNVTCRPLPEATTGIGQWQHVFEAIGLFAMLTNVGYAVFVMYPMRHWGRMSEFAAFIALEHVALIVHIALKATVAGEPHDVSMIHKFNTAFVKNDIKTAVLKKAVQGVSDPKPVIDIDLSVD